MRSTEALIALKNDSLYIMAKSTGYFGLRRGSAKSHTFQVVNGRQFTKGGADADACFGLCVFRVLIWWIERKVLSLQTNLY